MDSVLKIDNLNVHYKVPGGRIHAIRDLSLEVREGEILGVVGESGSGKSTLALAISKLLPRNAVAEISGKIFFENTELLGMSDSRMDKIRGTGVFMVFQDPFQSLNPLMRVEPQIAEAVWVLSKRGGGERIEKRGVHGLVIETLDAVRITEPVQVAERYPHQLSGGQNQRVMLAMAIAEKPRLLIMDEPTTALDVTTQSQILALIKEIVSRAHMSVVFITHDLAVASSVSDRVAVMYGGMIQELGPTRDILLKPRHPYTVGLINSIPSRTKRDGPLEAIKGTFSWAGIERTCAFAPRCPLARDACRRGIPALIDMGSSSFVRCLNYGETYES